jgi:MSHA biogenesis protein MshP
MCPERPARRASAGFSTVVAIFLVLVLAILGSCIASVVGLQQSSGQLDVLGVRAYHGARAGLEWGARNVLDPGNTLNPADCAPANMPSCPVSPTHLSGLGGSLAPFTVTVSCTQTADTTEGNRRVKVFTVVASACNQPSGGACPNPSPGEGYVSRELQATFSKCTDPTAAAPRCACG